MLIGAKGLLRQLEGADGSIEWRGTPPGLEKPLLQARESLHITALCISREVKRLISASELPPFMIDRWPTMCHQVAIESGSLAAVNFLLSKRADVTSRASTGHSAFHVALSLGDADTLGALETSLTTASLPDGALFAGSCEAGHDLEHYTAKTASRNESSSLAVNVRLGLWTRARGSQFYLRLRHGQLVATFMTGEEAWCCDSKVEIGSQVELRWSSWDKAQERWAQGMAGPLRMVLQVLSKDSLLIMGEEPAYFSHWNSAGYEGQVLFDGVSVLFDGQGDQTRKGDMDYVNVFGREACMDGQHYYEFKIRKVVCNLAMGLTLPEALHFKEGDITMRCQSWSVRFKPQYNRNELVLGRKVIKIKKPLEPHSNTVGMLVDMTKRAVLFLLNGEILCDPCRDLPETLYLMATLDTEGDHFEVSQPSPPKKAVESLQKISACGEVSSWMCDDCLCTYSRIQNTPQVHRWACRRCGATLCEGCRMGIGNLPSGYCGLSVSAWRDSGVLAIDDDAASLHGFRMMLTKQMCWSRGQLIDSLFLACLANHGHHALQLLMKMRENMRLSSITVQTNLRVLSARSVLDVHVFEASGCAHHLRRSLQFAKPPD